MKNSGVKLVLLLLVIMAAIALISVGIILDVHKKNNEQARYQNAIKLLEENTRYKEEQLELIEKNNNKLTFIVKATKNTETEKLYIVDTKKNEYNTETIQQEENDNEDTSTLIEDTSTDEKGNARIKASLCWDRAFIIGNFT